jgi:hypothetical protein
VVEGLLPLVKSGRLGKLLLDYHNRLLEHQGLDAAQIHASLLEAGMSVKAGRMDPAKLTCYVLYEA